MDEFDDFPGVERVEVAHGDEAGEVYATPCAEVDDCNNCSDRFEPSNDFTEPALQEDDDWGSEDEQQQTYSNDVSPTHTVINFSWNTASNTDHRASCRNTRLPRKWSTHSKTVPANIASRKSACVRANAGA